MPKTSPIISRRLFMSLGFLAISAVIGGSASIVALSTFQRNFASLTEIEMPTLADTTHISRLSVSIAERGEALLVAPNKWKRQNEIEKVNDDAAWMDEILGGISDSALPRAQKEEMLRLKQQLISSYHHINLLTENRLALSNSMKEIGEEIKLLQEDLSTYQFSANLPYGALATTGPTLQWNETVNSIIFTMLSVMQAEHISQLGRYRRKINEDVKNAVSLNRFLPERSKSIANSVLDRFNAILSGNNAIFTVKENYLQSDLRVAGALERVRTVAERFASVTEHAILEIRSSVAKRSAENRSNMTLTIQILIGLIVLSAIVALVTFIYVSNTVLKRLSRLRLSMLTHAGGKNEPIDISGNDEIAEMANSLEYFVGEIHTREEGLLQARDHAEQASTAKTKFLAAASHDLRQPLQALNLFVYALGGKENDPEKKEIIDLIRSSLDSLKELLNSLLDISKLEAGVVKPEMGNFLVGPLLARIAGEMSTVASSSHLELKTVPCSASIYSDPTLLETIIRNLLDNAIKYTDKGRVLLGCRKRDGKLWIEVWDNGPGIAPEQKELIFQDFYQIDNEARRRTHGLGLGLSIVKRLTHLLGCQLVFDSNPGRGTAFRVEVPISLQHIDVQEGQQKPARAMGGTEEIVIIEDDEQVITGLKAVLDAHGYHTWAFNTVERDHISATFNGGQSAPDLIIADYRLDAGVTGKDAIDLIRGVLDKKIPAIIITGDTAPERLREAEQSGLTILHKPVRPEELIATVRQTLSEI